MIKEIEYYEIDEGLLKKDHILVDLRSPGEFAEFTIPHAVNIPIFDDAERELIGYTYMRESVDKAKNLGINIVSKRLPEMYSKIKELESEYSSVICFCERGGMRSTSLVGLLSSLGSKVYKLKGGYKAYRAYINDVLPKTVEKLDFVVIHGNTGVGKTKILVEIDKIGGAMLDLEGCANHRGSFFGSAGLGKTNSQKQFESNIYESLKTRKGDTLFIEAESKRIGRVMIPEYLFKKMIEGKHINVYSSMEKRIENILDDYDCDKSELLESLEKLRAYRPKEEIESYIDRINEGDYKSVAKELMESYYDPMYEKKSKSYLLDLENKDEKETAKNLLDWLLEDEKRYG
jgi:tRNA 2-selenouridine synthase